MGRKTKTLNENRLEFTMKYTFKVGERINSETLGYGMTQFTRKTRFFRLTFRKGRKTFSAVYQLTDNVSRQKVGTMFLLTKLFGDKKLPPIVLLSGGVPLPCEVEIIDEYNLAEHAIKYSGVTEKTKNPVTINLEFTLSL